MAAVLFELCDGCKSAAGERKEFGRGQESELACCLPCVEQKAKVCWRNAGGFIESFFLHIVGEEVVMVLAPELVKVAPGAESVVEQEDFVGVSQKLARFARRLVEPHGDNVSDGPEQKSGRGERDGVPFWRKAVDEDAQTKSDVRHQGQIAVDRSAAQELGLSLVRGLPLKKALSGNEPPDKRADNGIE